MEDKNKLIDEALKEITQNVNSQYPNLIDEEKIAKVKAIFGNSPNDYNQIISDINKLVEQAVNERKQDLREFSELEKDRTPEEMTNFTLDLDNNKNGLYLSQEQIDLLMITELNSKQELQNYVENICAQFSNKNVEELIPAIADMSLEDCKRLLYQKYQDNLDSYIEDSLMSQEEKMISKFSKMGISKTEQEQLLQMSREKGISATLSYLSQTKGPQFITELNRLIRDDFENIKSVDYDEMKALSDLIQRDKSIDTLIIATGNYGNCVFSNGQSQYFDPYFNKKGLAYCEKHNLHMRYHALFDQATFDKFNAQYPNFSKLDAQTQANIKKQILNNMKTYVEDSMSFIEQNNKTLPDGTKVINMVEIFNELVEKNKTNSNASYTMVWEKFGISVEDIVNTFSNIKKPDGVAFMYNETTLTESKNKRAKVEETLYEIEKHRPGLIDTFGDQAHLSEEDLKNNGMEIAETASMLKRVQDGKVIVKGEEKDIGKKKIEMTEHDFHFSKGFVNKNITTGVLTEENIKKVKKSMQEKIVNIYKSAGIKFEKVTYWAIFNKADHNKVRTNKEIAQKNKRDGTNKPLIDNMYAGTFDSGKDISKITSLKKNSPLEKQTSNKEELNRMFQNDSMVTTQKQSQNMLNNPKMLIKTSSNKSNSISANHKGSTSVIILILLICLALGILVYFIICR